MAENVVTAEQRADQGKGPARRLRQKGLIPAVVYGHKREPTHVAVNPGTLLKAIDTPHKFNTLLTLRLQDGDKYVLFKDYSVDPVSRKLLHADFLEVSLEEPVRVDVPVVTVGKAQGTTEGGILTMAAYTIAVEALANKIPERIEVDVTELKIGRSLHISELKAPEGCKFKYHADYVVVFVAVPEKEEAPVPGAPGAAPAEGAAAAPAAGAAPAAAAPAAAAKGGEAKGGEKAKK